MTAEEIAKVLEGRVGADNVRGWGDEAPNPWIEISSEAIVEAARFCHDDPMLAFDYLKDLCAVDWLVPDEKKAKKLEIEPHLQLLYQLFSFEHKHDLTLKVSLPRWSDDKEGELPEVPSVSGVWKIADWHEREIYDLMGVRFTGHPNLRRILCPEDWTGHPLRKDYVFPKEYHGIRCS